MSSSTPDVLYERTPATLPERPTLAPAKLNQRIAVFFTRRFGSMATFYLLVIWMLGWMALASLGIGFFGHDRYPFSFLLFCSNLIQLWALPLLAVGQNVLSKHAESQADAEYAIIEHMSHENDEMANHLAAQDAELIRQSQLLEQLVKDSKGA